MKWQVRIQDPSGETRIIVLKAFSKSPAQEIFTIGRTPTSTIPLRDPTLAPEVATFWVKSAKYDSDADLSSPFWIKISDDVTRASIGDLQVRTSQLPSGIPVRLGESFITLEPLSSDQVLPHLPPGVRPWLTHSKEGRELLWTAKKVAATPLSLYLAGETGTGKEVLAHLLHSWSDRSSGPFVPLHCGALPLSLVESELFGHVKGAFTGADHNRAGALMQAHGGTLFLDEVGDLPLDIQVKLLRFLENGEIKPVGADRSSRADARLLCATHHSLEKLVEEGKFRRDLYYRIASVTLKIPTLRSRPVDVEMLARRFADDLKKTLTGKAILRLKAHRWPGNVRELRHAIERACGLAGPFTTLLDESAFDFLLTPDSIQQTPDLEIGAAVLSLAEMERLMIIKVLKMTHGNRTDAAKILGIARSTLLKC